jgi:hypothetical protein
MAGGPHQAAGGSGVMERENARPLHTQESSAPNSANSTARKQLTPRQQRAIDALAQSQDWLPREAIDRIAGSSNGPQVIMELRRKVTGDDGIEMERVEMTDRDGRSCRPGRYRLTPQGRSRLLAVVGYA